MKRIARDGRGKKLDHGTIAKELRRRIDETPGKTWPELTEGLCSLALTMKIAKEYKLLKADRPESKPKQTPPAQEATQPAKAAQQATPAQARPQHEAQEEDADESSKVEALAKTALRLAQEAVEIAPVAAKGARYEYVGDEKIAVSDVNPEAVAMELRVAIDWLKRALESSAGK